MMKRFVLRALGHRESVKQEKDQPIERSAPAEEPRYQRRSYLRLPGLRTSVSFPRRNHSNNSRRGPLSDIDPESSVRSLQPPQSVRSADELAHAPVLYDSYDQHFVKSDADTDSQSTIQGHTLDEESALEQVPTVQQVIQAPIVADGPRSLPLRDTTLNQVRILPNREIAPPTRRGSFRSNRLINRRHHSLDRVRPRKPPMFNKPIGPTLASSPNITASGPIKNRRRKAVPSPHHEIRDEDEGATEVQSRRYMTASRDRDLTIEPGSIESSQFTRRAKTMFTEPVSSSTSQPLTPQRPYRKIDESPYSGSARLHAGATGECKIYHAYTDALQKEARGRAGGLTIIVDLLRESEGNPIIIEKAALAIGILSENDPATRDVFGQHSAVQSLLQCLSMRLPSKHDRPKIVSTIVFAIACLLKESPRNVHLFETFDGPHKMGKVASSERYENCPTVPNHALKALSELKRHPSHMSDSYSHTSTNSSSAARTIKYVLRAMTLHDHRTDVQEHGLDALRTLLSRAERGALDDEVLELSSQATGTAFKMHSDSREVQWQCLTLLCDLDDLREGLFSLELDVESFFGALRLVVIDAKINSPRKPRLGKALLGLIRRAVDVAVNNGWRSQDFKDSAVEAGAVETVLDILDTYGHDAHLVDKICTILRVLLQSSEGRFRMNTVSSACAILSGIETVNAKAAGILPT